MAVFIFALINIKTPIFFHKQADYDVVYAHVLRFALASVLGTTVGAFVDVYCFAKLRILWKGRSFWLRCLIGNVAGDVILTLVVYPITFFTVSDTSQIVGYMLTASLIKLIYIALGSPVSGLIVSLMQRVEKSLPSDECSNLSPFQFVLEKKGSGQ
jgi:uncharacterized integral membrane protein (TIGR00697 family)